MGYDLINWQNSPNTSTPINANNLNHMDEGIKNATDATKFGYSATFTADGILKYSTRATSFGVGSFTSQKDIVTAFIANSVTAVDSGSFVGCTALKTIYVDNNRASGIIENGATESTTKVVYADDDEFINVNEFLMSAIVTLKDRVKTIEDKANSDKTELSEQIQGVKNSALEEFESLKADKLDKTDFNSYKTSNDNAVNSKVDTTDFNAYKSATDKAVADNTKSIKANTTAIDKCVTDIANNSALISKNQINVTTDKASNIVISDSSNYNIVSLVANNDNYNISLYGKNLQDFKKFIKGMNTNAYVAKDSLTTDNNTISYDMTEGNYCGLYFKYNGFIKDSLLIDKSCVISLTVTVDKACTFRLLDERSNKSVSKALKPSTETQISLPITLNQSTKAISFYGVNITDTTHIKLSNIMIELGSVATEYEEYKDMQSVTQDTDLSTVHTYYPITTVIADSDVQLSYVADTKHYIDNKFNEIATALVAHESEVN